jgi:ankyrin repeat protein
MKIAWSEFPGHKFVTPLFEKASELVQWIDTKSNNNNNNNDDDEERHAPVDHRYEDDVQPPAMSQREKIEGLMEATKEGQLSQVQQLLCDEDGLDPNARGYMGWTAAHWAARMGHLDLLEYFDTCGANLEILDLKVQSSLPRHQNPIYIYDAHRRSTIVAIGGNVAAQSCCEWPIPCLPLAFDEKFKRAGREPSRKDSTANAIDISMLV